MPHIVTLDLAMFVAAISLVKEQNLLFGCSNVIRAE